MSQLFVRTLREDPADAEVPSHRWLVRAGYIRRVAPGIYSWLPLGLRVMRKIEAICREEMAGIGAQEVCFPALLASDPYKETGRWVEYGDNLFRLKDRKGAEMLLGPTHEEMFTLMVKDLYSSYKDLPLCLYQIQNKYRDEARPRAGILRGREFVMMDAYSFDVAPVGLDEAYQAQRDAYIRIFNRLGLDYAIVKAMSGPMGGSRSEEFLAIAANGEDTFVRSPGGYAANVEAVRMTAPDPLSIEGLPDAEVVDTPEVPTIESLVRMANEVRPREDRPWTGADTLKNVVFMVTHPDGKREAALEPAVAEPFTEEDFAANPQLVKGYIGPGSLGEENSSKVRYLVDPRVVTGTSWITGADQTDRHVFNMVAGRDFTPDGVIDVAEIREGDPAPDGSGELHLSRGIEIGHIFQLGKKYADALGLKVLDQNGKLVTVTMGSYGLGVSRAVAAIAESTCDDKGLAWPREVAPFDVQVLATGKGAEVLEEATRIASELAEAGLDVLLDDRKASPGVKFADSEILGMPTSVVVGRGLKDGLVEVRDRATGENREVSVAEAVSAVLEEVRG